MENQYKAAYRTLILVFHDFPRPFDQVVIEEGRFSYEWKMALAVHNCTKQPTKVSLTADNIKVYYIKAGNVDTDQKCGNHLVDFPRLHDFLRPRPDSMIL